ncbi:hypothetical protein GOP47_0004313 [Adiantum capillus-veneris]|uniref:Phototropic-responsive NPH3 family protein n=1 Tax=Adiantum capillus-veneris TaxID=13818 RepID=A0A9D4ZQ90_ADICA|nr:hypothetical protein GOP47_0004313 [Adiantum capillus-veneris]
MTASQITPIGRHPNSWAIPDVPSDIVVEVDGVTYALHKFPLVSRCGLLRMLVVDDKEETSRVELEGVPGGAEGFELAAKFCYGVCLEISKYNIALLRCVAEFLDMSEEHGEDNLVSQTEAYLERLGKQTLKDIVATLTTCEKLLPMAEELKIVSRCVDWAAVKAVQGKDSNHQSLVTFHEYQHDSSKVHIDWWVEDLSVLRIDFYQRVLAAMRARGLRTEGIGGALVYYAHQSLKGLTKKNLGLWDPTIENTMKVHDATTAMEHEQRILVETIVSLLPREKQVVSVNFLIGLLRTACILETTLACRLDLERRISIQLHRANLDDLLIPSLGSCEGETLFNVDIVHRLFVSFFEQKDEEELQLGLYEGNEGFNSPSQHPMLKVGKLLDAYLTEVASDANLSLSKFMDLAELLPDYARPVEDGLYKAIDIFLKAHSSLTDVDRKKLCRLLDFQKLSQEACTHAAQNERLPVQAVVQVLFLEQLRIRNVMAGAAYHQFADMPDFYIINSSTNNNHSLNSNANQNSGGQYSDGARLNGATVPASKDHYASVRRENRELKLEVARMKMRLSDLEKEHQSMKQEMERSHTSNTNQHQHGFLHAVSKSISKLNPFHHHQHKLSDEHLVHHQHKSISQPEPHKRAHSVSSSSSKASKRDRLSVS